MTFKIGNVSIPYEFIRNNRSKYIRIRIGPKGMRVTAPPRVSFSEVENLLNTKSKWIYENYTRFEKAAEKDKPRLWDGEETIPYLGNEYNMSIFSHNGKRTIVEFDGSRFLIYVNSSLVGQERTTSIENAVRSWFSGRARDIIGGRLEYFTGITGLKYNSFRIKEQKTRWGSCSKKGNLNFNWKIIMFPEWVMDYVILHEVCHLKHLNHSKKFWDMVAFYNPEYKKAEEWIKKNKPIF